MAGILIDYRCTECGFVTEQRVQHPAASVADCALCGAEARRVYSFRLGSGRSADAAAAGTSTGHGHDHPDALGTCGLLPTAARALTARLSGDERGLEREFRAQERMISEGTLTPSAGVHGLPASPPTVA